MLRKVIFAVCALALTLSSCGHQVTPDRGIGGLTPGQMQIKFSTQGPLDFVNNYYVLAFNTSGTGSEPYAQFGNQQQNWLDWSFEIVVGQPNAGSQVQVSLWQFVSTQSINGGTIKQPYRLQYNPQDIVLNPNCNNTQTQFCVTINRQVFNGITATAAPSSSPSASPSSSPSPTPSGSPAPTSTPLNGPASTWFINWFVASPTGNPTGQVISAAGSFGITDTTFIQQYDMTTQFDSPWTQPLPPAVPAAPNPSSQIVGGEVVNSP